MTDHELETRLRDWYRLDLGSDEAAPDGLRASLGEITAVPPANGLFGDRRTLILLAAAAMLTVAAIGSALIIGSGLIPAPEVNEGPLFPIMGPCEPTIPDGVALTFQASERPGLDWLPRYVVYEDGRVLRVESSITHDMAEFPSGWTGWWERNLTPVGLQHIVDLAQGIEVSDCERVYVAERASEEYLLTIRTDNGVSEVTLGQGYLKTGASDSEAVGAAEALANRFAHPDLGLEPSDWTDPDWVTWADRSIVTMDFPDEAVRFSSAGLEVPLPDGSTILTFGETLPRIDDGSIWRCDIVSAEEAEEIVAALDAAGFTPDDRFPGRSIGGWWSNRLDFPFGGAVTVEPALPHEDDCRDYSAFRELTLPGVGEPEPTAMGTPDPQVAVSVCELMAGDPYWQVQPEGLDANWTSCLRVIGNTASERVYARVTATSSEEGLAIVRDTFGEDGYVSDQIAGRAVYLNECVSSSISCQPAIAISADPYFVIALAAADAPAEAEERLRVLAALIIHNLEN